MRKLIRHKGIWILAVALSLSLIGAALSVFLGGKAGPLTNLAQTMANPFKQFSLFIDQNVSHLYGQAFTYDQLLAENKALKQEVAALRETARNGDAALRENARLRELLAFRQIRKDLTMEPAKVLTQSATNWNRSITISKGEAQGIAPSDCVVDATGALIGVVTEVGSSWSTVYLLTDAGFEMGGEGANGERGILSGDFSLMAKGQLKLSYLPRETKLKPGDEVQSFATEGVYPSGILVGEVTALENDPSGMYSYAILRPAARLSELYQVFVITDYQIEE